MTQYATAAERDLYGCRAAPFAGVSTDQKNKALTAASRLFDGYARARYDVPLTSWDDSLKLHVCRAADYLLMSNVGFNPEGVDVQVRLGYEDAIAFFRDVAAGRATFAKDATDPEPDASPDAASDTARGW